MPAIASLTINDGLASPVAHTFAPVSVTGTKAKWADRSPTIPAGFRTISHELLEPNGSRTTNTIKMGYMVPTVATVNGVDTVVRYNSAQVILNIHPESTLQDRKDLNAYVANSLDNALIKTTVENLEPAY